MTNLLSYNAGVYGGLLIMLGMFYYHFIRPAWRGHKRAKRLKAMVERSVENEQSWQRKR